MNLTLDFDDVLIKPKRSTLESRKDVEIEREFQFYYSPRIWKGVPIICSNMSSIAGFQMAKALGQHKFITCLHKYLDESDIIQFFIENPELRDYVWVSIGYSDEDIEKLKRIKVGINYEPNICIDVPNGYIQKFVTFCSKVRENFPESIIMGGNVCTYEMVQELIIHGKLDVCKVQIGPGCFVKNTKVLTNKGYKKIQSIKNGDLVLTHTGKYQKVTGTKKRLEENTILDINGIKCTKTHPFYVIHKNDSDKVNNENIHIYAKWVSAEDLSDDYFLISSQERPTLSS